MTADLESMAEPQEVEEIRTGIVREWFLDRKIVSYRITMVSQIVLENWADLVMRTIQVWPDGQPYLAIHNLSQPGVSLPYASFVGFETINIGILPACRAQTVALLNSRDIPAARVAIHFNLSLSGRVNKTLADHRGGASKVAYRTFYNTARALTWLNEPFTVSSENTIPV